MPITALHTYSITFVHLCAKPIVSCCWVTACTFYYQEQTYKVGKLCKIVYGKRCSGAYIISQNAMYYVPNR